VTTRLKRRAFPGRADQIANARDFTRRVVGSCPVLDEAMLLVSELAANALEHTATGRGGHFDVTIYRDQTLLIIAVRDEGSDKAPATRPLDARAEDGRGLALIELIADRWGYWGNERGRTIWFELRGKSLLANASIAVPLTMRFSATIRNFHPQPGNAWFLILDRASSAASSASGVVGNGTVGYWNCLNACLMSLSSGG
jgi:serine/threonine-protein kinase RsbW